MFSHNSLVHFGLTITLALRCQRDSDQGMSVTRHLVLRFLPISIPSIIFAIPLNLYEIGMRPISGEQNI